VPIREICGQKHFFTLKTKQFQPWMERIVTDAIEGMQHRYPMCFLIRAHP
jgi:hypothetical protein